MVRDGKDSLKIRQILLHWGYWRKHMINITIRVEKKGLRSIIWQMKKKLRKKKD